MKTTMHFSRTSLLFATVAWVLFLIFQSSASTVTGVVTHKGKPVDGFTVRTQRKNRTTTNGGYYKLTNVSSGESRIYIGPKPPASAPRYYPKTEITKSEEIRCYEMIPYYAAAHGAFDYDLRLHRSWGNALDNPFDTASGNALFENTHTLSGIAMKPVYAVAVVGEVVWTVPGSVIALGAVPVCKVMNKDFGMFGFSKIMLAGYLPIEAAVKVIEVPVKTILWPVDRLVSWSARNKLNSTRTKVLNRNSNPNQKLQPAPLNADDEVKAQGGAAEL